MSTGRFTRPPRDLLEFLGVAHEPPIEVYCPECRRENPNYSKFLVLRYGGWLFYLDYKRKDVITGEGQGIWVPCKLVRCESGHLTCLCDDGQLHYAPHDLSRTTHQHFVEHGKI